MSSSKLKVGVLRGGTSHGYADSLKTGEHLLSTMRAETEKYDPIDIFISKDGEWHHKGVATSMEELLNQTDVVWNTMHGAYGEKGELQKLWKRKGVKFVGSHALPSMLSLNKEMSKDIFKSKGILTPKHAALSEHEATIENLIYIFRNYLHPVIVKPVDGASSGGLTLAHTFEELKAAVETALQETERILVEEYIRGTNTSCGVIEKARGEDLYALLPSEEKMSSKNSDAVVEAAKKAHALLGLRHYSESDFIITPKGKLYMLETNSIPRLGEDSNFSASLNRTGWKREDFVDHLINLALIS
ncbi:MAG: D-alanyl-alanine synthetase D-alanine-D-alanine ligase [Parcubacteria group bacterium]|nr:D-alanyl-alanine synthetase D-alanine-D-alanine ligase [Parcubacteria group bacterium]